MSGLGSPWASHRSRAVWPWYTVVRSGSTLKVMNTGWEEPKEGQGAVSDGAGGVQAAPRALPVPAPGPCHGHTCHGQLDVGTDLALQPIGGDASVVAGIIAGHPGEVQGPRIVCHPLWEAAPICRGNKGKSQAWPASRGWLATHSGAHLYSTSCHCSDDPPSAHS